MLAKQAQSLRDGPWRSLVAVTLVVGALAGCGPDGPDAPGAQAAVFDGDVGGTVLQPGDPVILTATEFAFSPEELVVEPGAYSGEFVNDGKIAHNLTFETGESFDLGPGESVDISFVVPEGGVRFLCSIAGHEAAGMVGELHTRSSVDADDASE